MIMTMTLNSNVWLNRDLFKIMIMTPCEPGFSLSYTTIAHFRYSGWATIHKTIDEDEALGK